MLASIDVEQRPGTYTFVTGDWPGLRPLAVAIIDEVEATTLVVEVDDAVGAGAPVDFESAWLTLTVWSSPEAVGLTAAVSTALASNGIACNMLAGYHHDHLLVPADRVDDAMRVVRSLATIT